MNKKEMLIKKLDIATILFNNGVPVEEAKAIGTFIETLEQQVEKQEKVIDKAIEYMENNLQGFLYSVEYKTLLDILKGGNK